MLIIASTILMVIFFLALVLLISKILDLIFDIVSVFLLLTPNEIEKEMEKCKNFIETCFSDEYEVKIMLKSATK